MRKYQSATQLDDSSLFRSIYLILFTLTIYYYSQLFSPR